MPAPLMAARTISDPVDRVDQAEEDREHRDPERNGESIHAPDLRPGSVCDPCRTGRSIYRFCEGPRESVAPPLRGTMATTVAST